MIEGLLQLKNRVLILNNNVIKFSIIYIYLNTFFRFINKDHWETDEECAEMYEFFLKILIQPFLKHFEFINDYEIQKAVLWFHLKYKIDDMIL